MKKKLLTVVFALVLTVGACVTCFAGGPTIKEEEIMTALYAGVELNGTTYHLSAANLAKAENYLSENDLDDAAVDAVKAQIESAKATVVASGVANVAELKEKLKTDTTLANTLTANIQAAAKAAGTEVKVDLTSGTPSVTIGGVSTDTGSGSIANTGFNFAATAVAAFAVIAVLGGCVVLARKNDLFATEA